MAYDGSLTFNTSIDGSGFQSGLSKINSAATTGLKAIGALIGTVTAGITAIGGYAVSVGSSFEAGMSEVSAISGATGDDLAALTEKAKEMGAATKFSATEASEALKYMAMAGWKTDDMLDGLEGIMNLAAASGENLGSVSDIVTDALTAFGLQASDSAHFADVLAKASSNSNTNVGLMGATFKYVAPIAGAMKYSIEDTAVAIGLMANAGIKGEQAGTSLRSMLTRLVKPPKMAADALDALNFSATNSDGSMKPLNQTLQELRGKFADLTDSEKAQYAANIAGQEAMSGFLAIMNASDEDFDKLTASIADADGAAKDMAETMQDNLSGKTTILKSSLEGLGLKIYESLEDPLKDSADEATDAVNSIIRNLSSGKLKTSMDKVAKGFAGIMDSITDLVKKAIPKLIEGFAWIVDNGQQLWDVLKLVIGVFVSLKTAMAIHSAIQSVITGFQTLVTVLGTMTGGIGLAVIAIGGLLGGLSSMVLLSGDQRTEMEKLNEQVYENAEAYEALKEEQAKKAEEDLKEVDNIEALWKELQTLVDEEGNVVGSKDRVREITEQLNEEMPGAIEWVDDETLAYKDGADAIDKYIQKKRIQIQLDAKEAVYKEALEKHGDLEKEQIQRKKELQKATLELAELEDKLREAQLAKDGLNEYYYQDQINQKKQYLLETQKAYDESEQLLKDYYYNINGYEEASLALSEGNYDKATELLGEVGQTHVDLSQKTKEQLRQELEEANIAVEQAQKRYNENQDEFSWQMYLDAVENARQAREDYIAVGGSSVDGYIEGIDGKLPEAETRAEALARESGKSAETEGEISYAKAAKAAADAWINNLKLETPNTEFGNWSWNTNFRSGSTTRSLRTLRSLPASTTRSLVAKMQNAVLAEQARTSAAILGAASYHTTMSTRSSSYSDNRRTSTVNIYQPVKSPAELERILRKTDKELANGF
ncbi:phage tail tape measure protein [[Clostridium] leptum]|nr:phage tail tape measure protein [[Clostridium] leptum]